METSFKTNLIMEKLFELNKSNKKLLKKIKTKENKLAIY